MCAARRLLNQYLLDGGVFNVLRGKLPTIGAADFVASSDLKLAIQRDNWTLFDVFDSKTCTLLPEAPIVVARHVAT